MKEVQKLRKSLPNFKINQKTRESKESPMRINLKSDAKNTTVREESPKSNTKSGG